MNTLSDALPGTAADCEVPSPDLIRTAFGTAEVVHSTSAIPPEIWRIHFFRRSPGCPVLRGDRGYAA